MPRPTTLLLLFTLPTAALRAQGTGFWEPRPRLPSARQEVAAALESGRVWVSGGLDLGGLPMAAVDGFDPALGTWTPGVPLPTTLHHHGMATTSAGMLVVGGYVSGFTGTDAVWLFDRTANQWRSRARLPRPRGALVAVELGGLVYAVGGVVPGVGVVGDLSVYDPGLDRWTPLPPMPTPREHLGATALLGKLWVAGGRSGGTLYANLEVFDPGTGQWQSKPNMPTARGGTGAAALGGRLIVMGGEGPMGNFPQTEEYDPATNTWRALAAMTPPLHGIYPVTVGEEILVAGGGFRPGYAAADTVIAFRYLPGGVSRYGTSTPACRGPIVSSANRRAQAGDPLFALLCSPNAPPGTAGLLLLGTDADVPGTVVLGARLHVDFLQPFVPFAVNADAQGAATILMPLPGNARGARVFTQFVWLNTTTCPGTGPLSSSDALALVLQ